MGSALIIRHGPPAAALEKLARETGAVEIHCNASPDPSGKSTELKLAALLSAVGIGFHVHPDSALHGPEEILTGTGGPYRVFTPYFNNWISRGKPQPLPVQDKLPAIGNISGEALPTLAHWKLEPSGAEILPAGERAAHKRLAEFLGRKIFRYEETRDFPGADGTSRISQDLRHGLLSIRTVFQEAGNALEYAPAAAQRQIRTFLKELAWRDFYFAILHHFPNVLDEEFAPTWRGLPWDEPEENFTKWQRGTTGFPIVDAGMRELLATGFMHNRVRMITAMFLTKDLHHDWKLGESHFMQHLTDGEIASNNGGWQWSAGTGADAAPYFRIQNPWAQSARFDPGGTYIKRWVPELGHLPAKQLHAPPANGKPLAADYPLPCVEHKSERERTLAIFKRHSARMAGKA